MKLILMLVVIAAAVWLWRNGRRQDAGQGRSPSSPPAALGQEDMPACLHCGVHFPRSEAVAGRAGVFCGEPHRRDHEAADAAP